MFVTGDYCWYDTCFGHSPSFFTQNASRKPGFASVIRQECETCSHAPLLGQIGGAGAGKEIQFK